MHSPLLLPCLSFLPQYRYGEQGIFEPHTCLIRMAHCCRLLSRGVTLFIFNAIVSISLAYIQGAGAATEEFETIQISIHDTRMTAFINEAPIDLVFAELAKSINIKVYHGIPLTRNVSVSITDTPVQEALQQILSGLNFAIEYNDSGRGYPPAVQPGVFTVYIISDAISIPDGVSSQHLVTPEPSSSKPRDAHSEEYYPASWEALNHIDPEIRLTAINTIVGQANNEDVELIYPFVNDQSARVREAAIIGITVLAGSDSIRYLEQLASDPSVSVRETSYELAEDLGDTESVRILSMGLRDSDPFIQQQAIESLAELGNQDALTALRGGWQRGGTSTRKSILRVLPDLPAAVPLELLSLAFNDHDARIRREAVYVATELGSAKVAPFIYRALEDEDIIVRDAAKEAITEYLQQ